MKYPAIIHKGEEEYGIFLPDFPGVVSGGRSVEECLGNLQDAVECVFEATGQKTLPEPSSLDAVINSAEARDGAVLLCDIDPSFLKCKARRVNISIPEYLLARIDKKAHVRGMTRSAYMVHAASSLQFEQA